MKYALYILMAAFAALLISVFVMRLSDEETTPPSNDTTSPQTEQTMQLSSSAFAHEGAIPMQYTCDAEEPTNPSLAISNIPEGTESLVLVMDDPDIPAEFKEARGIEAFDHWAVYNIPGDTTEIPEASTIGNEGLNGAEETGYRGPCPPPEYEPTTHRYIFRVYALSGTLNFVTTPTLYDIEEAAKGMMLGSAELIGTYDRSESQE